MIQKLLKSLITILMAIALTIGEPAMAQTSPKSVTYIQGGPPIPISSGVSFSGGLEYADGQLRFSLSNGTPKDELSLTSDSNPTAKGAITVDSSGSIFLGNGSGTNRIGSIAEDENGSNGQALTINFSSPLTNAGFETGDVKGWTAFEQNYSTVQNLNGKSIAYDFGGSTGTGNIIVSTPDGTPSYTVKIDNTIKSSGNYSLRLVSSGNITSPKGSSAYSGNGSLHGPYIRSDSFQAFAGDSITLDFSAQKGEDAYEVFGFLIGAGSDNIFGNGDDTRTQLFAKRGDKVPFNTVNATIPTDGQYEFEFVCGSYDLTGGLALGASLYIDNVRLVSDTLIPDAVVQAINDRVVYKNTSKKPNTDTRHLGITRKTSDNVTDSATVDIQFVGKPDCQPPNGEISGIKWNDVNGDGKRPTQTSSSEVGLAKETIYLDLNNNGKVDSDEPARITADDGGYQFHNLALGTYTVREVSEGYKQTAPADGFATVNLTTDRPKAMVNFGNQVEPKSDTSDINTLINIDAQTNNRDNPIHQTLPAGSYQISLITPADGGTYEAWNSSGIARGCDASGENCDLGWETRYYFRSPYHKVTDSSCDKPKYGSCRYNNSTSAVKNAPAPELFSLNKETEMLFYIEDSDTSNNVGGVSLKIEQLGS